MLNPEWTLGWEGLSGLTSTAGHCMQWRLWEAAASLKMDVPPHKFTSMRSGTLCSSWKKVNCSPRRQAVVHWYLFRASLILRSQLEKLKLSWWARAHPGKSVWKHSPFSAMTFFRQLPQLLNKSQIQYKCYHKARAYKNALCKEAEEGTTSPQNEKIKYALILLLWSKGR